MNYNIYSLTLQALMTKFNYEQKGFKVLLLKPILDTRDLKNGKIVVEDVKGYRDPSSAGYAKFVLKRKLMLYVHGIIIKEV